MYIIEPLDFDGLDILRLVQAREHINHALEIFRREGIPESLELTFDQMQERAQKASMAEYHEYHHNMCARFIEHMLYNLVAIESFPHYPGEHQKIQAMLWLQRLEQFLDLNDAGLISTSYYALFMKKFSWWGKGRNI